MVIAHNGTMYVKCPGCGNEYRDLGQSTLKEKDTGEHVCENCETLFYWETSWDMDQTGILCFSSRNKPEDYSKKGKALLKEDTRALKEMKGILHDMERKVDTLFFRDLSVEDVDTAQVLKYHLVNAFGEIGKLLKEG